MENDLFYWQCNECETVNAIGAGQKLRRCVNCGVGVEGFKRVTVIMVKEEAMQEKIERYFRCSVCGEVFTKRRGDIYCPQCRREFVGGTRAERVQIKPWARECARCKAEFEPSPGENETYCDSCVKIRAERVLVWVIRPMDNIKVAYVPVMDGDSILGDYLEVAIGDDITVPKNTHAVSVTVAYIPFAKLEDFEKENKDIWKIWPNRNNTTGKAVRSV